MPETRRRPTVTLYGLPGFDGEVVRVALDGAKHGPDVFLVSVCGTFLATRANSGRPFDLVEATRRALVDPVAVERLLAASRASRERRPDTLYRVDLVTAGLA